MHLVFGGGARVGITDGGCGDGGCGGGEGSAAACNIGDGSGVVYGGGVMMVVVVALLIVLMVWKFRILVRLKHD